MRWPCGDGRGDRPAKFRERHSTERAFAMRQVETGRRLAGRLVYASQGAARSAASSSCGRRCARKTPARPAPWAWGARPAAWSTRRATFPRSAKSRCRPWSPTCRGPSAPSSSSTYSHRPAAGLFAARAGSLRPADDAARCSSAQSQYYRPISWDDALRGIAGKLGADRARRKLLVLQRPQLERSRFSAAALCPAVRHEQCQQLQLLLPPGQRRRAGQRAGRRHGHGRRSKTSKVPTWCSSSAAIRPATIRG